MLSETQHKSIFDLFEPGGMEAAERQIEQEGWVSDEELSLVLERNPDQVLSTPLREFLMRKARKDAGLTQQEVADRIGKPQSFVAKYEGGERRLDVIEFIDVAEAIGVEPISIVRKVARGG